MQSFAPNLKGNTTAGIRLDIPPHLHGVFKLLESHANRVRSNYKEGMKRSIKFNDVERSLSLDIKLPHSTKWHRVEPALARESRRAIEEAELEEIQLKNAKKRSTRRAPKLVTHGLLGPNPRPLGKPGKVNAVAAWRSSATEPDNMDSISDDSFGSTLRGESAASPSREVTIDDDEVQEL